MSGARKAQPRTLRTLHRRSSRLCQQCDCRAWCGSSQRRLLRPEVDDHVVDQRRQRVASALASRTGSELRCPWRALHLCGLGHFDRSVRRRTRPPRREAFLSPLIAALAEPQHKVPADFPEGRFA